MLTTLIGSLISFAGSLMAPMPMVILYENLTAWPWYEGGALGGMSSVKLTKRWQN